VFLLSYVYNEVVISATMKRMTADAPLPEEDAEDAGLPDPDYEKYRLAYPQIMTLATSVGLVMVATRMALEGICYYFGREA